MNKTELRNQLNIDLEKFKETHSTVLITNRKRKVKYPASGKQKKNHYYSAPINRPTQNWDLIPTKLK